MQSGALTIHQARNGAQGDRTLPQAKRQSHLIALQVPQQGIGCLHSPKAPQCAPVTTPFSLLAHGSAPGASAPPLGAVCVVCAHYTKGFLLVGMPPIK